jgi:Protein of unknown function (DUF3592)
MILLAIILLAMFCSIFYLMFFVYLGLISRKWACTIGKLVDYKIKDARFVSIKVKYEYTVNGTKYFGNRISFLNPVYNTINAIESDEIYNKLKTGEFNVFYLDKNPKISTLKTGYNGWTITLFLILIQITVIVILLIYI